MLSLAYIRYKHQYLALFVDEGIIKVGVYLVCTIVSENVCKGLEFCCLTAYLQKQKESFLVLMLYNYLFDCEMDLS